MSVVHGIKIENKILGIGQKMLKVKTYWSHFPSPEPLIPTRDTIIHGFPAEIFRSEVSCISKCIFDIIYIHMHRQAFKKKPVRGFCCTYFPSTLLFSLNNMSPMFFPFLFASVYVALAYSTSLLLVGNSHCFCFG
jgi:hypothetical protein